MSKSTRLFFFCFFIVTGSVFFSFAAEPDEPFRRILLEALTDPAISSFDCIAESSSGSDRRTTFTIKGEYEVDKLGNVISSFTSYTPSSLYMYTIPLAPTGGQVDAYLSFYSADWANAIIYRNVTNLFESNRQFLNGFPLALLFEVALHQKPTRFSLDEDRCTATWKVNTASLHVVFVKRLSKWEVKSYYTTNATNDRATTYERVGNTGTKKYGPEKKPTKIFQYKFRKAQLPLNLKERPTVAEQLGRIEKVYILDGPHKYGPFKYLGLDPEHYKWEKISE